MNNYVDEMLALTKKGYDQYVGFVYANLADLGIPEEGKVLVHVKQCLLNNEIPSENGLVCFADADHMEANALLRHLSAAWQSDIHFVQLEQIYSMKRYISSVTNDVKDKIEKIETRINQDGLESFEEYLLLQNPLPPKSDNLFDFFSGMIPFDGRSKEIAELNNFCQSTGRIKWDVVTGSAGVGKSRLAFELCKSIGLDKDWYALFLNKDFFSNLDLIKNWRFPLNLLCVVDYTDFYGEKIGLWLNLLCNSDTVENKIRILLLSRNKYSKEAAPIWYKEMIRGAGGSSLLRQNKYRSSKSSFNLEPLSDESKKNLLVTLASENGKDLNDTTANELVIKLKDLDPHDERILFMLFLYQAWSGGQPWQIWNYHDLQTFIYDKEISRMQRVTSSRRCEEGIHTIWTMSTILGPCKFSDFNNLSFFHAWLENLFNENNIANPF